MPETGNAKTQKHTFSSGKRIKTQKCVASAFRMRYGQYLSALQATSCPKQSPDRWANRLAPALLVLPFAQLHPAQRPMAQVNAGQGVTVKHTRGLLLFAVFMAFALSGCAPDPKATSAAEVALIEARRKDAGEAIKQQWLQDDANIRSKSAAEMNLAKDKAALEIETQQKLDKLKADADKIQKESDAKFAAQIAKIESESAVSKAEAQRSVDTNRALGAAAVVLAIGVSFALARIANAPVIFVKNWAKQISPTKPLKEGDRIYDPGKSLTPAFGFDQMPFYMKPVMWWMMLRTIRALPTGESPWAVVNETRKAMAPDFGAPVVSAPADVLALTGQAYQAASDQAFAQRIDPKSAGTVAQERITRTVEQPKLSAPNTRMSMITLSADASEALSNMFDGRSNP